MSTWTSLQNGVALNLWSPLTPSILYMKPCSASPSFFPPSFLPSTQLSQLLISAACHTELLSVLNPSPRSLLQPTNRLHFSSVVVAVAKFRQWLQTKVDQNETSFMFFMSSKCLYPHPKKKKTTHTVNSLIFTPTVLLKIMKSSLFLLMYHFIWELQVLWLLLWDFLHWVSYCQ